MIFFSYAQTLDHPKLVACHFCGQRSTKEVNCCMNSCPIDRSLPAVQCIQNQFGPIEELVLPSLLLYGGSSTDFQHLLYCQPSLSRGRRWKGTTASYCDRGTFPRIVFPRFLECFFSEEAPQASVHEDYVPHQFCPTTLAFGWAAIVSILVGICLAN